LSYLDAEKRALFAIVENLWDKYAVSSQTMEKERENTLLALKKCLSGLGYLGLVQ
jgi:type I restriction enzyme M protein